MKKEVLLAIVIGLTMGLVITFGFYRVKNTTTQPPTTDLESQIASASATPQTSSTVSIHTPKEGVIQKDASVTVAGTTTKSSIIVLTYDEESAISESDDSGNFSFDITLNEGPHIIALSVLEENGSTVTEERAIVISDIFEQTETEQPEEPNEEQ